MSASFFSAEARECTAELAELLESGAPPAEMRAAARRLRGSAQMASREFCVRAARAIEGALRAAEAGACSWDADSIASLTAAVEGMERVIDTDTAEAAAAVEEAIGDLGESDEDLRRRPDGTAAEPAGLDHAEHLRGEVDRVRRALEEIATPGNEAPEASALHRLLDAQAPLSGSARLAEAPVVARVVEAADHLARAALAGAAGADSRMDAFSSLAGVLADPRAHGEGLPDDLAARIEEARSGGESSVAGPEAEVPVEVANFFRAEAAADLARAEQLARDAAEGRTATAADRLRALLEALATTATTFGFGTVAERLGDAHQRLGSVPAASLPSEISALTGQVMTLLGKPPASASIAAENGGGRDGAPRPAAPIVTAGGEDEEAPDADGAVPIAALCYAGTAALDRAASLRSAWRTADGDQAREIVEEIFDLIDLARKS